MLISNSGLVWSFRSEFLCRCGETQKDLQKIFFSVGEVSWKGNRASWKGCCPSPSTHAWNSTQLLKTISAARKCIW